MIDILNRILLRISESYDLSIQELTSASRKNKYARPRQICYALARAQGIPFETIGEFFDRHHTTIIHGDRTVTQTLSQDEKENFNKITNDISEYRKTKWTNPSPKSS